MERDPIKFASITFGGFLQKVTNDQMKNDIMITIKGINLPLVKF